jgi:pimeloyl-ACP methyl ester carboxylesterase
LTEVADKLNLEKFHLIGETVGGSISMNYSTRRQERLRSLAVCTSPTSFDSHHQESAALIEREGIDTWVDESIGRRLDPQMVDPAYIRWYADQMKATPAHVVAGFQANASGDIGPLLKDVQTPVLVLAAANLREEVLGDFRGAADLFPNGKRVVFPGVYGFVQHILPVPCARAWLDWVRDL